MRFRALDIETVPDEDVWTRGESKWRWIREVDWRHTKLPADSLCPTVRNAMVGEPVLVADEPFPPLQANRVVAISCVDVVMDPKSSPRYRFDTINSWCRWATATYQDSDSMVLSVCDDESEKFLLGEFASLQARVPADTIITWNGRSFDLPVLSMRSLKHGVPFAWYYDNRNMRYRFTDEGHFDLMDYFGDYGAGRGMKLSDACHLVGLPGKTDMTGASVHVQVEDTRRRPPELVATQEKVRRYCTQDALQTALFWLRTRHHVGRVSAEEHDLCAATFRDSDVVRADLDVDWDRFMLVGRMG